MHCLSAREYRVGVDVVADAVQVFDHRWSYHLWFDPCWSYHLILSGSTECRTCWNSTNPDEYGTGWEVRLCLIVESKNQILPDIRLSLCEYWRTIATMNPMHFQHFNWSQHHDDIQGTLLLMGQVKFFWLVFQVPSLMWCPGPGKVEAGSETKDWGAWHRPDLFQPRQQVIPRCATLILVIL